MKTEKLVFSLLFFLGAIFLFFAAKYVVRNVNLYAHSTKTIGIVVQVDRKVESGTESQTYYTPVLAFEANGKAYKLSADPVTDPGLYVEGKTFPIRYYSDDPWQAKVDTFDELWLAPLLLGILGGAFLGFGFVAYRVFGSSFNALMSSATNNIPSPVPLSATSVRLTQKIRPLLQSGQKIEAVKIAREELKCDLKTALAFVENVEKEM